MNGNQNYREAARYVDEASQINNWDIDERVILAANAQALATLALVDEQRTANMLLAFQSGVYDAREWPHVVKSQIAARLGIPEVSEGAPK